MTAANLTVAPHGGGTTVQTPTTICADGVSLISYVSSAGYPSVCRYTHSGGGVDTVALTASAHVDDHDRPALLRTASGDIIAAWAEHGGTAYTRVSTDTGATWGTAVTLSGAYTYPVLFEDGDGVHLLLRDSDVEDLADRFYVEYVSTDGGASWGSPTTIVTASYLTAHWDGSRLDVFRRESWLYGSTWDIHHAYYDGTWRKSDGTAISTPFTKSDMSLVYADATLKATSLAPRPGLLAYTTHTAGATYPDADDVKYRLATYDAGWTSEDILDAGDGFAGNFLGCAVESASSVYLVKLVSGVHQVWHYTKSAGSWSGVALTDAAADQLRPAIPLDARSDLPVVWDYGTWDASDDWEMGLAGLVRGTPSAVAGGLSPAWPSLKP